MIKGLKIRVVVDDSASTAHPDLWAQHGLSLFLELDLGESGKMKVLMDTGASSEITLHNADALKTDLKDLDLIFLSHGHYDHTGGLLGILERRNRRLPVLAHPDIFCSKLKSKPFLKFIGPPFTPSDVEALGAVMLYARNPVSLAEGFMTTGEVERRTSFETIEGFYMVKEGMYSNDTILDDQALIVNIDGKGLAIISGCAHAGIINTIMHAQNVIGVGELYAVIGGFHLDGAGEEIIDSTAEELARFGPKIVRPGHCTGIEAICRITESLGNRCKPLASGETIEV